MLELVVVVAVVAIVAVMLLGRMSVQRRPATIIGCVNNLKQVGLATRIFATDNDDRFPARLSTNEGGSLEYGAQAFAHFMVMSNELSTPSILVCAKDSRLAATDFVTFGNSNLSYFVSLDAGELEPSMVLSGHRNLTVNGRAVPPGLVTLSNGHAVAWTSALHSTNSALLYADGSVMLRRALIVATNHLSTNLINRLAVP